MLLNVRIKYNILYVIKNIWCYNKIYEQLRYWGAGSSGPSSLHPVCPGVLESIALMEPSAPLKTTVFHFCPLGFLKSSVLSLCPHQPRSRTLLPWFPWEIGWDLRVTRAGRTARAPSRWPSPISAPSLSSHLPFPLFPACGGVPRPSPSPKLNNTGLPNAYPRRIPSIQKYQSFMGQDLPPWKTARLHKQWNVLLSQHTTRL